MAEPTPVNGTVTDTASQNSIMAQTTLGQMALQNAIAFQQAMNQKLINSPLTNLVVGLAGIGIGILAGWAIWG